LTGVADGPVFLDPPLNSSSYAHRQGDLAVQLPAGARDLRLKLLKHEGFVFGTAYSPETVAGETHCGVAALLQQHSTASVSSTVTVRSQPGSCGDMRAMTAVQQQQQ
jgi:hypothetical protein